MASEADSNIESLKNRVTHEYTTDRIESVRHYWNGHDDDIRKTIESDKFLDSYLQGNEKSIDDAKESNNFIENYACITGPCIHEVLDVDDSVLQSDQFLQSYLDGDKEKVEENEFQKKSKIIKEAQESDMLLEKYLLGHG